MSERAEGLSSSVPRWIPAAGGVRVSEGEMGVGVVEQRVGITQVRCESLRYRVLRGEGEGEVWELGLSWVEARTRAACRAGRLY